MSEIGTEFVLERTFDAPRDRVFRAWTSAEDLSRWFGPKGFTMLRCEMDLRPGGVFHYGMTSPQGQVMWGKWVFREVTPPERIVFVASFSDELAGIVRHPMAPTWPAEVLSTVEFSEPSPGRTTLTMRALPINANAEERALFENAFEGMTAGWGGTLAQLEAFLSEA